MPLWTLTSLDEDLGGWNIRAQQTSTNTELIRWLAGRRLYVAVWKDETVVRTTSTETRVLQEGYPGRQKRRTSGDHRGDIPFLRAMS